MQQGLGKPQHTEKLRNCAALNTINVFWRHLDRTWLKWLWWNLQQDDVSTKQAILLPSCYAHVVWIFFMFKHYLNIDKAFSMSNWGPYIKHYSTVQLMVFKIIFYYSLTHFSSVYITVCWMSSDRGCILLWLDLSNSGNLSERWT